MSGSTPVPENFVSPVRHFDEFWSINSYQQSQPPFKNYPDKNLKGLYKLVMKPRVSLLKAEISRFFKLPGVGRVGSFYELH